MRVGPTWSGFNSVSQPIKVALNIHHQSKCQNFSHYNIARGPVACVRTLL